MIRVNNEVCICCLVIKRFNTAFEEQKIPNGIKSGVYCPIYIILSK